jgi:hypothetical protein
MAKPVPVEPVKLLAAVLWSDVDALAAALEDLRSRWGKIDVTGSDHPFDVTDYYEKEMGAGLLRRIVSFEGLVLPQILSEAKLVCNEIENKLAHGKARRVNLDIGYLDHNKIVLGSAKYAGQKIYLGAGIYADLVARYREGRYQPFEWTFPDFRDGRYDHDLAQIRRTYLSQLRAHRATARSASRQPG